MFPYLMLAFSSQMIEDLILTRKQKAILYVELVVCIVKFMKKMQVHSNFIVIVLFQPQDGAFKGKKTDEDEQITICDEEYSVKWKNVKYEDGDEMPQPLILSMDIEVNSTNQVECLVQKYPVIRYFKYRVYFEDMVT